MRQRREKRHMQQRAYETGRDFAVSQKPHSEVADTLQGSSLYHVHIACFKDGNEAEALVEKLRKQGYDRAKKIEAGAYSRVVVASCPTEAEAAALVREVRKRRNTRMPV